MNDATLDIKTVSKLNNEGRIKELRPDDLLRDMVGLGSGMTCVDFGSGTGVFALPMVHCVGNNGVVYAVDNNIEMLSYIRTKNPSANLKLVHRDVSQTGLNNQIADLCLLAFILHEVKSPEYPLAEAFRLLKPEGKVLVVEWRADVDPIGPPREKRLTKDRIEQLFVKAGLFLVQYRDWSVNHFVALGKK